ncbi:hypothetical protein [Streptomyces sp. NPDC051569]|uniref:hypothetical protein n=1 Tax=Streptomyces sp. NPDC051569 TaxID=3365661 RepID=UPI00379F56DF
MNRARSRANRPDAVDSGWATPAGAGACAVAPGTGAEPGPGAGPAPGPGPGESLDDLLVQIADGSRTAFARLYDRTAGLLFAAAVAATPSPTAAEERLAVAYVRIWKSAGSYRPGTHALAWILHQTRSSGG